MEEGHGSGLSVPWVFAKAGEIFKPNAVKFTAIMFVALAPGFLLRESSGNVLIILFSLLLLVAGTALAGAAVAIATLGNRDDADGDIMRLISRAMPFFGTVFVAQLIVTVAFLIGLVILILPGIAIYSLFMFAIPAIVAERKSGIGALERSVELGQGARFDVFLVALIYFVLFVIVFLLANLILGQLFFIGAIIRLMLDAGLSAFGVVLAVTAYVRLREAGGTTTAAAD